MERDNASGPQLLLGEFVVCPNPKCKRFSLTIQLVKTKRVFDSGSARWVPVGDPQTWRLVPPSDARVFPDYIPKQLRDDYEQACLIRDLSAKASASLARRCLQGMIRDFWGVRRDHLINEIEAIKDKIDPLTWKAIDSVRSIGNIGAHMEKDVNLIIDVDPDEARQLIWLIETLFKDWYISKREREENLKAISEVADAKKKAKAAPAVGSEGTGAAST